jgi:hypothetical protein
MALKRGAGSLPFEAARAEREARSRTEKIAARGTMVLGDMVRV